jgi:hypothetical protein
VTHKNIAFCRVGEEFVTDFIPLVEIVGVEEMSITRNPREPADLDQRSTFDLLFENAFQVRTKPRGRNAGRKYCFKATDCETCTCLVMDLKKFIGIAVQSLDKSTLFEQSQEKARNIHNSDSFQRLVALMTIAVKFVTPHCLKSVLSGAYTDAHFFLSRAFSSPSRRLSTSRAWKTTPSLASSLTSWT